MLEAVLGALLIFALRVCDMSMDTLRVMSMVRGKRIRASLFGLVEAGVFIMAIAKVLSPPIRPLEMAGYAAGFAAGTFIGMTLAQRLTTNHVLFRVLSPKHGEAICWSLRDAGFAVTCVEAEGKSGPVPILWTVINRKNGERLIALVRKLDPKAFIVSEPIDHACGGFVPRPASGLVAVRR